MFPLASNIFTELLSSIIRTITGRLYTEDQIRSITSGALGRYFAEFFPTPKDELEAQQRVDAARKHIEGASSIIRDMQQDLEEQDCKLNELLREVEQKQQLADRYQALAETKQEAFQAFRAEMEEALGKELQEQAERGRGIRRAASIAVWIITLMVGAGLGAYFKDIVEWFGIGG